MLQGHRQMMQPNHTLQHFRRFVMRIYTYAAPPQPINPSFIIHTAASVREATSNLFRMLLMWLFTVFNLILSHCQEITCSFLAGCGSRLDRVVPSG